MAIDQGVHYWRQLRSGDDSAYVWLYREYADMLYNYGLRFTPDTEKIKDCIQDIYTNIYSKRASIGEPRNVKIYLLAAMRNGMLNLLYKDRIRRSEFPEDFDFLPDITPEDIFIESESEIISKERVREILEILTSRQREIIYYRFMEELDYEQICELMSLSQQAAYNLLQRSFAKIRDAYDLETLLLFLMFLRCGEGFMV